MLATNGQKLDCETIAFYRRALEALQGADVPFLVGGAYAFDCYVGIERHTKDLDLFIRRADFQRVGDALRQAGFDAQMVYPHWLAKAHAGAELFIDLIFSSGNGIAEVDDDWFAHALNGEAFGIPVKLLPAEEMIWSKAFIMERERYDGADIAHLLHGRGARLDWHRLLRRFDCHWRVLLSHLVLYGFIYPRERHAVPDWVMEHLLQRLREEMRDGPPPEARHCYGTLLSREQYLPDIERLRYEDARLHPHGNMTRAEIARWTDAIADKNASGLPEAED